MEKIKGIAWAGTKTDKYEKTAKFFKEILGLKPVREEKDITVFQLPNGDLFEVIGPTQGTSLGDLVSGPKVDFLVDNAREVRRELEELGVPFHGPLFGDEVQSWTHFFAPDGYLYGLTDMPDHPLRKP